MLFVSIFIIIFFIPTIQIYSNQTSQVSDNTSSFQQAAQNITYPNISSISGFAWPLLNYTRISSYFGRRSSPTAYASSYHKGIDIPAPPGTNIYAAMSGTVVGAKFSGSGGCTVTIQNGNLFTSYCHVSPNFLVCPGTYVEKGQLIAQVGPKNVYGFPENKYKDSNGNPTNGATTGPHLHFAVRNGNDYLNPLDFFSKT